MPLSPHAITKFTSECYLAYYEHQYGLEYSILRYANVYGPRQIPHGEAGVVAIFMNNLMEGKPSVLNHFPEDPEGEFKRADVLLTQLDPPLATVIAAVKLAARNRVLTILNPAPAQPLPDDLLKHVSILTPNESEAELLTGIKVTSEASGVRAAAKLRARGVQIVIITLGAKGALMVSNAGYALVPGFRVRPIDTTAAGDVFNGALAVALAEKLDLRAAVQFANAAAAISVTRMGAQPSAPARGEIDQLVRRRCVGLRKNTIGRDEN